MDADDGSDVTRLTDDTSNDFFLAGRQMVKR